MQKGDWGNEVLCWEAANPTTTPERLKRLFSEGGPIAVEVARNPNTPLSLLESIAKSEDSLLCCALIQNTELPAEILTRLSSHKKHYVRRAVASSRRAPAEAFWWLAN